MKDLIDHLSTLSQKITPGPWGVKEWENGSWFIDFPDEPAAIFQSGIGGIEPNSFDQTPQDQANMEFIALVRNNLPLIITALKGDQK